MSFAAALSEHPVAADAVGEVLGSLVEDGGVEPDLAVVFLSTEHAEFAGEITSALHNVLKPKVLLGCSASAVLGRRREAEEGPAMSVWASWSGEVAPVRLETTPLDEGVAIQGLPADLDQGATLLLLADPFSFPADGLVDELSQLRPDVTVVGGMASAAASPGGNALMLDRDVVHDGAVGAVIPRELLVGPVVSQGCRPVGEPMVVTGAEGNFLLELAGQPALERLDELINGLSADDRVLMANGVHLGIVIDEGRTEFEHGDFLIRNVLGGDKERGVLAVGEQVPVGTTVQFQVRDATSADQDLHRLLDGIHGDGALLFTCNGRGVNLFGTADHDANAVADRVGTEAVAGMFCAGEIGPVGGRSFLHGFTASVLIFADDQT
ncbi:MAG: FIST N-terminal domain-containing protein [Acidimicrobiales bacterium]|nr:FIST N-terminal domain-containing protein [Acidimicrobiales bacterium]